MYLLNLFSYNLYCSWSYVLLKPRIAATEVNRNLAKHSNVWHIGPLGSNNWEFTWHFVSISIFKALYKHFKLYICCVSKKMHFKYLGPTWQLLTNAKNPYSEKVSLISLGLLVSVRICRIRSLYKRVFTVHYIKDANKCLKMIKHLMNTLKHT